MKELIFITGGQRSGKSSYAQKLAEGCSANPVYVATARSWDDDFKIRIKRHQADRGEQWQLIEEEKELSKLDLTGKTVVLDCVTLWLTNIFHDNGYHLDNALVEAKKEWEQFTRHDFKLFVVSNEIGMCLHAPDEASRHFTDLQGWFNQYIASRSTTAYLMVSGISIKLK